MLDHADEASLSLFENVPGSAAWHHDIQQLVRFAKITNPEQLDGAAPEVRRHVLFALAIIKNVAEQVCKRDFKVETLPSYEVARTWFDGRVANAPGWRAKLATLNQLSWPTTTVDRVGEAAGRVTAILEQLCGPSLTQLRHDVWRACFGPSLYRAWPTRNIRHDQCVLVLGPTGTGKELVAEAIAAGSLLGGEYLRRAGREISEGTAHPR